jgi:hypothetical protein
MKKYYRSLPVLKRILAIGDDMVREKMGKTPSCGPRDWSGAGIPKPDCEAIFGAIDMESWNNKDEWWGSFSQRIKFMGADMSKYEALLKKNGFAEPEDSYTETWELEKRVKINGVRMTIMVEDTGNAEIPEADFRFSVIEDE